MNKGTIYQRAAFQAEFESLVWQMMARLKRGETIPDATNYRRIRNLLQERAEILLSADEIVIEHESDWLALILYADDRHLLAQLCQYADAADDPTYRSASRWLENIFQTLIEEYGANA